MPQRLKTLPIIFVLATLPLCIFSIAGVPRNVSFIWGLFSGSEGAQIVFPTTIALMFFIMFAMPILALYLGLGAVHKTRYSLAYWAAILLVIEFLLASTALAFSLRDVLLLDEGAPSVRQFSQTLFSRATLDVILALTAFIVAIRVGRILKSETLKQAETPA